MGKRQKCGSGFEWLREMGGCCEIKEEKGAEKGAKREEEEMEKRHKCGSGCPALGIPRSRTSTSTLAAGLGSGRRNGRTGAPFRSPKAAARLRHPTPLGTHRRAAAAAAAAGTRRPAAARSRSPWCGASRTATAPCAQRSAPRSVPAAAHRPRPRLPLRCCWGGGRSSSREKGREGFFVLFCFLQKKLFIELF